MSDQQLSNAPDVERNNPINPNEVLSDLTVWMKYARYKKNLKRRETWREICDRNRQMHKDHYQPSLHETIDRIYDELVIPKKILPSMRSMQFAGKAIIQHNSRMFNCAYAPIDCVDAFGEIMFLLLGGTGMGYSVQKRHIEHLPSIIRPMPGSVEKIVVDDSIEGWGDAIKNLFECYTEQGHGYPSFDLSHIRPRGAELVTSGGKAPGPEPLKICLDRIEQILQRHQSGDRLKDIDVHDIVCHIADAVYAGGIRRAALICLFDRTSTEMLECKSGAWWEGNAQRGRANNSAVLPRGEVTITEFHDIWTAIEASGSGEPGVYWTNNEDWGTNPCVETALRPYQFCNLVEINASSIESEVDLYARVWGATILGTLQAGYTHFNYLRPCWKENTEKDALLGVSMTGLASRRLEQLGTNLEQLAQFSKEINEEYANKIGVNPSARITCIKPAGTTSLTLGTSSGVHAWHDEFYIRRVRVGKQEAIYQFLLKNNPGLVEDCKFNPEATAIVSMPQRAPKDSLIRTDETAIEMLERVKHIYMNWVLGGHSNGVNTHNISATISLKPNEWDEVGFWMWSNRDCYNGISVLPFDGGTYIQAPFESITEEQYSAMLELVGGIDLSEIIENEDGTDLVHELACSGGVCEVN